jgi:hypothetical protein
MYVDEPSRVVDPLLSGHGREQFHRFLRLCLR